MFQDLWLSFNLILSWYFVMVHGRRTENCCERIIKVRSASSQTAQIDAFSWLAPSSPEITWRPSPSLLPLRYRLPQGSGCHRSGVVAHLSEQPLGGAPGGGSLFQMAGEVLGHFFSGRDSCLAEKAQFGFIASSMLNLIPFTPRSIFEFIVHSQEPSSGAGEYHGSCTTDCRCCKGRCGVGPFNDGVSLEGLGQKRLAKSINST